jgi:alpha-glucosidase
MQWNSAAGAGFTTAAKPWLPIPPSASTYNVESEGKDPNSIFNTYKRLLALRRSDPALRDGTQVNIGNDPHVFAFLRQSGDRRVIVALNMGAHERAFGLKPEEIGGAAGQLETLYKTPGFADSLSPAHFALPPFGALVAAVE